jgi:hypothetical protein
MQYVDDTILFLDSHESAPRNLKWFLSCFESMSGMRINYHKFDLVTISLDVVVAMKFVKKCCKISEFPFKYVGVPLHYLKLRKGDIQPMLLIRS